MITQWIDSVPAWALGPRASNSKFGGGIILAGVQMVSDRLFGIKKLSKMLGLKGSQELRSSGHVLHEVKTDIKAYQEYNAPTAISFQDLKAGIRNGIFPPWVAMTAPQFGFKGAERGGMVSGNYADYEMAKALHIEAIARSQELKEAGLGAGISIWWPAWTSRKVDDPNNPPMEFQKAWQTMLAFWVDVLKTTNGVMWLEWKPGDPGIDYLMTLELAILFCKAVNSALGRTAMYINNEFAHVLISGIDVAYGVKMTIDAGLFSMFVHANSGQKMPISIQTMLESGKRPEDILIGMDWDWAVGVGGQDIWNDQMRAIGLMDRANQKVIYCEHDVNPSGLDPFEVFKCSILNRRDMLAIARGS